MYLDSRYVFSWNGELNMIKFVSFVLSFLLIFCLLTSIGTVFAEEYTYEQIAILSPSSSTNFSRGNPTITSDYNYSDVGGRSAICTVTTNTCYVRTSSTATGFCDASSIEVGSKYRYSAMAMISPDAAVDNFHLYFAATVNSSGAAKAVNRDFPIVKGTWTMVYVELEVATADDICTSVCFKKGDSDASTENTQVIFDDFKIEKMTLDSTDGDTDTGVSDGKLYRTVALQSFDSDTRFFDAGVYEWTNSYNYSGETNGAVAYTLSNSPRYVRKGNGETTKYGICDAEDLTAGKTYRYSIMAKLPSDATVDTAHIYMAIAVDAVNNKSAVVAERDLQVNKTDWTMLSIEYTVTEDTKCRTMCFKKGDSEEGTPVIIFDDAKIDEVIVAEPVAPIETSFVYGNATAENISTAGDYTAKVKFNSTFTGDAPTVIFAKYVSGIIDDVEVIPTADLQNENTTTFAIAESELSDVSISVFVWNNSTEIIPLLDKVSLTKPSI